MECDGANYHRARTARDRDKLREAVLRDLGWRLHRIWSTDWWTDPAREMRKLEAAIEAARTSRGTPPLVLDATEDEFHACESSAPTSDSSLAPVLTESSPSRPYVMLPPGAPCGTVDEFYEARAEPLIRAKIAEVVALEGPISLDLAAKRVSRFWGFERIRGRAVDRIRNLIPRQTVRIVTENGESFLWPVDTDRSRYTIFRVPGPDRNATRDAADLPIEEIANAIRHILNSHLSAPVDEVVREVARLSAFSGSARTSTSASGRGSRGS